MVFLICTTEREMRARLADVPAQGPDNVFACALITRVDPASTLPVPVMRKRRTYVHRVHDLLLHY